MLTKVRTLTRLELVSETLRVAVRALLKADMREDGQALSEAWRQETCAQVHSLADRFQDRFSQPDIVERAGYHVSAWAKDYVDHNEWGIACDLLCQQLYEYTIPITVDELQQILMVRDRIYPEGRYSCDFLAELVRP